MARMVLIIGPSGTGKTSSLRNFKKADAQVISCSGKEMPFKSELTTYVPRNYTQVYDAIQKATAPAVIIDDTNFLMTAEEFSRAKEIGYSKFTDFALNLDKVFKTIREKDSDQTFYVIAHPEDRDESHPNLEFKVSAGKMSKKFPVGAMTNIVLETMMTEDGEFVFKTQTDGLGVKTPMGMFDTPTTPNDLKEVDKVIREYYKV